MGPGGPLIALLVGGLLGGVAGGTAGGVYTCHVEGDHYVVQYTPGHAPFHYSHSHHPAYTYYPYRWAWSGRVPGF